METITLVANAIHRPDEPRHFMEFQFPEIRYRASIGNHVLADSKQTLKLFEVGFHIYEPVIYFPLDDCDTQRLIATEKTSHCPLKGDTHYYDFDSGEGRIEAVGWRYSRPLDFAAKLSEYVAFDPRLVAVSRA